MKPLIVKEIRLLLPAFAMALLLAVVPIYFFVDALRFSPEEKIFLPVYYALAFGVLMLGLSSFGREFSMNTFAMLLAQPLSRARLWWTKIAVLGCATIIIFCAFYVSCMLAGYLPTAQLVWHIEFEERAAAPLAISILAILAGSLWSTLLLRQIMGAFWFALLIPIALWTLVLWNGGNVFMVEIALAIYSVAGFWWARRQFIRAQEVAWTGGEVNLPEWRSAAADTRSAGRTYRPVAAMLWKELQLFQVALAGMAGLFIAHLGVIAVRKLLHNSTESFLVAALGQFGGLWLLVPVVTGSLNVADERRLGTMEAQLCLPLSQRRQFVIKLLTVLLLSGFLSALLLWIAEGIGNSVGAGAGFGGVNLTFSGRELAWISTIFLGVTLIVFYASTLSRSILQAIAVAVLTVFVFMFLWGSAVGIRWVTGIYFWEGPLLAFITVPIMVVTIIGLAYGNYCRLAESRRLLWRNARGLTVAMFFATTLTTLIFHRTWEYLTPLEPPHGPAKLNLAESPKLKFDWHSLTVTFPDGRLWWENVRYQAPRSYTPFGENLEITLGRGKWVGPKGNHFLDDSNWLQLVHTYRGDVGIRTDGTLWVSEKPVPEFQEQEGSLTPRAPARLIRFGNDSDWKSVARESSCAVLLLKTEGTLWYWGTNRSFDSHNLIQFEPRRLGKDSDWSEFFSTPVALFMWKTECSAWSFAWSSKERQVAQIVLDQTFALMRQENFDNRQWRSFAGNSHTPLAVRADGTLWTFGGIPYRSYDEDNMSKSPIQIGKETNWVSVVGDFEQMFALKSDGTLWKWDSQVWSSGPVSPFMRPPAQVGMHNDWVALGGGGGSIWSLSADGSLWNWWRNVRPTWLMSSRKPVKLANIFESQ